jgi:hypothetical protein
MSSRKFERVKQKNPRLSELLDQLGAYIRAQLSAGQPSIIPKLAAAALGLTEGEAFVLLELLAQGDVLQRVYNVYCRDFGTLLDTVDTPDSLDKISHCDDHDTDHDVSDLRVEIAYRPKPSGSAIMAA